VGEEEKKKGKSFLSYLGQMWIWCSVMHCIGIMILIVVSSAFVLVLCAKGKAKKDKNV